MNRFRRTIARSRLARVAALAPRTRAVARHNATNLAASARWLVRSREHTNYTYDLTPLNLEHLAWWVSGITKVPVSESRSYLAEAMGDTTLADHVRRMTLSSERRFLADPVVRLHKRAGWYALTRALKPHHIVETGTDKGLGSVVLAAALLRNGAGRLTTLDVNPDAGYLIQAPYASVVDVRVGDSVEALKRLEVPVDMFLHDSLHTRAHELSEYQAVEGILTPQAVLLSDNAHVTDALPAWAEMTGRTFHYFAETPARHWYPGGGIGAAIPAR